MKIYRQRGNVFTYSRGGERDVLREITGTVAPGGVKGEVDGENWRLMIAVQCDHESLFICSRMDEPQAATLVHALRRMKPGTSYTLLGDGRVVGPDGRPSSAQAPSHWTSMEQLAVVDELERLWHPHSLEMAANARETYRGRA